MNDALQEKKGRKLNPSTVSLDSQSVKTTLVGGQRRFNVAKYVKARKHHIVVDTLGLLLAVVVYLAEIDDRIQFVYLIGSLKRIQCFPACQSFLLIVATDGNLKILSEKLFRGCCRLCASLW